MLSDLTFHADGHAKFSSPATGCGEARGGFPAEGYRWNNRGLGVLDGPNPHLLKMG